MADRRDEEPERIVVAAPRPRGPERRPRAGRPPGTASDAGLALIVIIALFAVAGALVGGAAGERAAGALIGGFVGVIAGFAGIYVRYRDL